ncbi:hypothetical protein BDF20DRAFT_838541 [Mycotypha africana]|uniref:uncharacterized protein n=1 Tax=Mycotypha africana TaxID=64632 RepID=UPI0023003E5D|nr:uncharacterized protein BDF20DRAFT_838541 [Mycotypha africana]KAI8970157.1 hypothetical protein BDF20DRAFT_838541 [Mycotypha africana]
MHISKFLVLALGASAVLAQDPNANPTNSVAPATDQPAPSPTDQQQPQPTDQQQPQPTDQQQPQPTDQQQPQPTDQQQPQPTDQQQPQPTDQQQPQPTDQQQPQPTDQAPSETVAPAPAPAPTEGGDNNNTTDGNNGNNTTTNPGSQTLADIVTSNNKSLGISKFGQFLQDPNYKSFLDRLRSNDVTCFIPSNKALDSVLKSWKKYAKKNKLNETAVPPADWKVRGNTTITDVLNYHCIDGKQKLDDLSSGNVVVTTLDHSRPLRIESTGQYDNNQLLPPPPPPPAPAQPADNGTAAPNGEQPPPPPADNNGDQNQPNGEQPPPPPPADNNGDQNQNQNQPEQQQPNGNQEQPPAAQGFQLHHFQDQTAPPDNNNNGTAPADNNNNGNGTAPPDNTPAGNTTNTNPREKNEYKVGNGITDTWVRRKDVQGSNGYINVIDEVLMPVYRPTDTLDDLDQTVTFGKLIKKNPDVVNRLNHGGKFTLFAPNNDAFDDIDTDRMDNQTINDIMNAHLVDGEHYIEAIRNDAHNNNGNTSLKAINGNDLALFVNGTVRVNDTAKVIDGNVLTNNGVIHVIDGILNRNDLRGRL